MAADATDHGSLVGMWAAKGAILLGAAGALIGLVVGLFAYVPTAWAAMFELGVPASVLGAVLGALSGAVASAIRGISRRRAT